MAAEAQRRRTLGDYFTLQRGTTYKSRLLGQPGPVLLGLASIQRNGGFRRDALRTYGGDSPEKLLVYPGELYVSLKDVTQSADLLGAVARLPHDHPPGRLTQDTVKLKPRDDSVPLSYLHWVLRTPSYRNYCRSHATGTTNLGLPRDDFLGFPAPEPTREQAMVVATLDALDVKIELNHRTSETLEAIARAIFKSWFGNFDPVRAKAEGRRIELSAEVAALFPDALQEADAGPVPRGWHYSTVGSEFQLTMGQSPPGSSYNEAAEGIPLYQGRRDFGGRFPTPRVYCSAPTRFAEADDTLVSVRAPVGSLNQSRERSCIGRGVAAIRHGSGAASYTYYALHEMQSQLRAFEGDGTVFGSINKTAFLGLTVLAPPDAVILAFEALVNPLDESIKNLYENTEALEETRDTLLPKLISGELRLPLKEEAPIPAQPTRLRPKAKTPGAKAKP